jgi:hypothetical protein
MKNLWADLQVDDNGDDDINFSLEQLERELAHLDDDHCSSTDHATSVTPSTGFSASPFDTAASIIVSQQQAPPLTLMTPPPPGGGGDAWQQSLEKFTALSLGKDFLAADSARKAAPTMPAMPPGFLADAEDYNVTEAIPAAPPGLGLPPGILATPRKDEQAAAVRRSLASPAAPITLAEPDLPSRSGVTKTPHNSVAIITDEDDAELEADTTKMKTPSTIAEENRTEHVAEAVPKTPSQPEKAQQQLPPPNAWSGPPPPQGVPPQGRAMLPHVLPQQGMMMYPQGMPPQGMIMPHPGVMPQQGMIMGMPPQGMYGMPPQGMPMGIPVPQMMKPGTPWQSPTPPPPVPPRQPLYCIVHPSAPPISSTSIESSMMTGRDLAYVLHSMLKPVLVAGTSPFDYDIQFLKRRQGQQTPSKKPKVKTNAKEMKARSENSMQFMKEKNTLGHTTKADVMRPRALLAVSAKKSLEEGESQEARAALWKARLHIDQGQQAATALIHIWQTCPPGTMPKQIQPHLMKLFRALGLSFKDDAYSMEPNKNSLAVILKLSKGKRFVARLLKSTLLPPKAVQVLVPAILTNIFSVSNTSRNNIVGDADAAEADAHLFEGIIEVVNTLPQWQPESLLSCLKIANCPNALTSPRRLEFLKVLLMRGNSIQDEEFAPQWKEAEAELIKMLD